MKVATLCDHTETQISVNRLVFLIVDKFNPLRITQLFYLEEAPHMVLGMAAGSLVQAWDVSNVNTKHSLSGHSTLYESRLWDHLDTFCYIIDIFWRLRCYLKESLAFGWWELGSCFYIPKCLPNGHKDARSDTEVGSRQFARCLRTPQYNLVLDMQPFNFCVVANQRIGLAEGSVQEHSTKGLFRDRLHRHGQSSACLHLWLWKYTSSPKQSRLRTLFVHYHVDFYMWVYCFM